MEHVLQHSPLRPFKGLMPTLKANTYVDGTATLIGSVLVGEDCSIWPMCAIRGDVNHIILGSRTNIQDGSVIHVSRPTQKNPKGFPTLIGEDVTIGHKVMLHGCQIGNRVIVGIGAIVLDGAIIEDDVIIGAGALVTPGKHLKSGYLYTGSPARQSRALRDEERQHIIDNANNYIELKNDYVITS